MQLDFSIKLSSSWLYVLLRASLFHRHIIEAICTTEEAGLTDFEVKAQHSGYNPGLDKITLSLIAQ